jgi:predicted AAA+ superfamily ATPase
MLDKTEILEILNDWNFWVKELPNTFVREVYEDKISSLMAYDEILVIKGIRRSGKSTLMINQIKNFLKNGVEKRDILYVNLEDPRFVNHLNLELLEKIKDVYLEYVIPSKKPYIFLDEIQNIPNFEKWLNKEYELKNSVLTISGSNSSMLSSEIASVLSGRYLSIDVMPLGFREFLGFKELEVNSLLDFVNQKNKVNRKFEEYLKYGGFPKVLEYKVEDKKELLLSYKDSILLKDIVARYKLKNYNILNEIAAFLLANSGIIQSVTKLKNSFKISHDMASSYLEYLKNAFLIYEVKKFDYSIKKQNLNDKKYYSADLGLSNIFRVANLQHRGSDIETVVFLELIRRGYKVYYYKTSSGYECDFLIELNGKITALLQVSKTLKDEKTLKREIKGLIKTKDELNLKDTSLQIVTEDKSTDMEFENEKVNVLNILEWLLLFRKL